MRQRILITGASSGLGAEMARQFAAKGRDLALCARRLDRLEDLRAELTERYSIKVAVRALDVTDDDAVFKVFTELADELGGLDRVIVNAGLGKGARLGTGRYDANRETAMTNFIGALAQCEATLEHFRKADAGHLVIVSSMSALRGMPGTLTTYGASKAAVASLGNGIRADLFGSPIKVTVLYPGYIASEMNDAVGQRPPMMASTAKGVRAMVRAIDREVANTAVPQWPWKPLGIVLRYAPTSVLRRFAS
ncbi:MAG TPA: SDR family oxidoreductase [Jatrophihabitantaceae bacterium]|nr:SDR family oxidoreductase [Jatrophihabitantaceae bacterium]